MSDSEIDEPALATASQAVRAFPVRPSEMTDRQELGE
jgi:hypothetical protein